MKTRVLFQLALVLCVGAVLTTGCHRKPKAKQPGTETGVPPLGNGTDISSTGVRPEASETLSHGQFAPVYFDFDSATIKPSEVSKLEAVAAAVKSSTGKLVVEGYADERGTAEYNRALGERRAQAAREELIKLGVSGDRISTVSYGEERPADPGHDEAAWAKNRRCEFATTSQ